MPRQQHVRGTFAHRATVERALRLRPALTAPRLAAIVAA
jgi:hypothetical protein